MGRARRHRTGALVGALGLVLTLGTALPATALPATDRAGGSLADPAGPAGRVGPASPVPTVRATAGRDILPAPRPGVRALRALDGRLPEAARRNDLAPAVLEDVLRTDETAWLDAGGRLRFHERAAPSDDRPGASAKPEPLPAPSAPLEETFELHSNPGAGRVVFLDMDGATVTGTQWNDEGVGTAHPGWDPAGDGPAFSDEERVSVQAVWAMVSEDYAAFDVDVTTEDPGRDALVRTSQADLFYGSHVVVTDGLDAWSVLCDRRCGGVAYISVFGSSFEGGGRHQPAWVFPAGLGGTAKGVAEAASHEVGHNLGLVHDGRSGRDDYYGGHGVWGPIMGSAVDRPVSQWSRGSYAGATNTEDDLAIIAGRLPLRPDEAGDGVVNASPLPEGSAYVTGASDVDTFDLGECAGPVSVTAAVGELGPTLDARVSLLAADGTVLVSADPAVEAIDASRATGMGATVTADVFAGRYLVSVDGVGSGTVDTGYDDYASIGAYRLSATGCTGPPPKPEPELQPEPDPFPTSTTLTTALTARSLRLTARVGGEDAPTGSVTFREGYRVLGTRTVGGGLAELTVDGVTSGRHDYSATFTPDDATRQAASLGTLVRWVPRAATRTTVRTVWRAAAFSRPRVRVAVRTPWGASARGRVTVEVRPLRGRTPRRIVTAWLRGGDAAVRMPLLRPGRVLVRVRFARNAEHQASGAIRRVTVVSRRR